MLSALGLSETEEALYRLVLGRLSVAVDELPAETGLSWPVIEPALARLIEWGLITRHEDQVTAAPPAVGLGALIGQRKDDLRAAEVALASFAEQHRAAVSGNRSLTDLVEVVSGVDAVRHRFLQVQYAAKEEVRNFVTVPYVAVPPGENAAESAVAERGVRIRVVVERATLTEPGMLTEIVESLTNGVEIRVAESLPMKLVIADSELGLVPLASTPLGEPGAVLLQRSGLLAAMEALFEGVWERAFQLELSSLAGGAEAGVSELDGPEPTDLDRKIITMLLAGLTDQAIAVQLDMSMRTLQRRLRRLLDIAGVQSRMQLGWHAAKHGWS